jgi:hypothetical protein
LLEGAVIVYVLQHVHTFDTDEEDVKLIGVYSSQGAAEAAAGRATELPGFRDAADGFSIDAYELDHDNWVEGYETV